MTLLDEERQALLHADKRFAELRREQANGDWPAASDRKIMTALAKAATELRTGLDNFTIYDEVNRRELLTTLQEKLNQDSQVLRTKEELDQWLTTLKVSLDLLADAAATTAGADRGRIPDIHAHVWVRMAAEDWLKRVGEEPSAKGGRFPAALQEFTASRTRLPRVGDDLIEQAIKTWRKARSVI